ncbi:hypothetical protein GGI25_004549 [Coemansia spiralis]|uniref:BED-type domain-containing protein n=1 Tax=Coemansia spiralis TaxID=417178 RepID=A0A9W8G5W5_9FUNG|nr:hypothetical protein GGI25_004549 [Coemansia spiralis]
MSKRVLNNGHLAATGPQQHPSYHMHPPAPTHQQTQAEEQTRLNKVENLLQRNSPLLSPQSRSQNQQQQRPTEEVEKMESSAIARSSGGTPVQQLKDSSQQPQEQPLSRQYSTTNGPPSNSSSRLPSMPASPFTSRPSIFPPDSIDGGPPGGRSANAPANATSGPSTLHQLPPNSPQDVRPRRMTFMATPLSGDAHRDHYETSFSRSTSNTAGASGHQFSPGSQASPQRQFFASSSTSGQMFPGRQQPYIQNQQHGHGHNQSFPPPPASAPSNQLHFNLSANQQQQPAGGSGTFNHRASYSGPVGPGMPMQRSLSPPPPGRRYLPVPGRYDIGGGLQRSPLPFPRIPSPKLNQQHPLQQQQQQQPRPQQPRSQQQQQPRSSPPSATAPLASVVAVSNSNAANNASAQSPVRESTRRLSSVVWGPTGFERLESGMSRCKICSKEYSKGSSTGTLKRHFRQHQINVGSGNSYSRPSPPTTGGTGNNATHHVSRPRAYSHRTESRTRREVSPFSSPPAARSLARFVAMPPHTSAAPAAAGVSSLSSSSSSSALASSAMVSAPVAPGMVVGKQGQPAASAGMRVSTASDMDTSSAIAGSALLSMAAGDQRMAVDGESIRRPARSSDPSVYPHQDGTSPDVSMVDPETRDISVSPSPSTATSAHENMLAETGGIKGFGFSESDRNAIGADVEGQVEGADSYAEYDSDDGGRRHPHKRRRATVTSVQSASSGEFLREGDPLSATELVALSSELMLRVAHALPLLAQEAAATAAVAAASKTENGDEAGGGHPDSQRRASLLCGSNGDPLDLLFGHIKNTLLDRSGLQNGTTAVPSSSSAAATSHPSPHATKAQQLLSSSVSPSSALSNFYNILSIPFLNRDSHQTTTASSALPYTVRKAFPFSAQTRQQPVTHTKASAESSSLYDMSLLSRVSAAMQRIAPLSLAELKWDNVGILLEAAQPRANASKVFLTIDLTLETLNEALDDPAVGVIVSYHPPIFFAWKSLTMSDHKQSLILKCAGAGVSIYSPHTSLDSCENGINDWLASLAGEGKVTPITPALPESADGQQNAGSGRIVELASPQPLTSIVSRVKNLLELERIRVARASCHESDDDKQKLISTVAVCAGAGNSVVGSVPADLYITGEMGHHEVLAAVAKGTSCILGEHSNTERGYLRTILVKRLQQELDSDKADETTSIIVSKHDKDPISIE